MDEDRSEFELAVISKNGPGFKQTKMIKMKSSIRHQREVVSPEDRSSLFYFN